MSIGTRIRACRTALGLTQKALGEQAGIAEPTIRKYESDRLHPKYETLEKLAVPLQVTADYLRDGKKRLADHLPPEGEETLLVLSAPRNLRTQLDALAQQRGTAPEELAVKLLSDAVFSALEAALREE